MIAFRPMDNAEAADVIPAADDWDRWEAEREKAVAACVAERGDHAWLLELEHPDDGSAVGLSCEHCPAGAEDLMTDGVDLFGLEVDGITVADGKHDSPRPAVIPVTAEVWGSKMWTDYGWEYDAGLEVHPRGRVRYEDGSA